LDHRIVRFVPAAAPFKSVVLDVGVDVGPITKWGVETSTRRSRRPNLNAVAAVIDATE
jgi:hypothetical protein